MTKWMEYTPKSPWLKQQEHHFSPDVPFHFRKILRFNPCCFRGPKKKNFYLSTLDWTWGVEIKGWMYFLLGIPGIWKFCHLRWLGNELFFFVQQTLGVEMHLVSCTRSRGHPRPRTLRSHHCYVPRSAQRQYLQRRPGQVAFDLVSTHPDGRNYWKKIGKLIVHWYLPYIYHIHGFTVRFCAASRRIPGCFEAHLPSQGGKKSRNRWWHRWAHATFQEFQKQRFHSLIQRVQFYSPKPSINRYNPAPLPQELASFLPWKKKNFTWKDLSGLSGVAFFFESTQSTLVGGFNPSKKYESKWESSGENHHLVHLPKLWMVAMILPTSALWIPGILEVSSPQTSSYRGNSCVCSKKHFNTW